MSDESQLRREEAREGVLRFLAERSLNAHEPDAVRRRLNREGSDFTLLEIVGALLFLARSSPALAEEIPHPMGASKTYRVTPQGVLAHERSGR